MRKRMKKLMCAIMAVCCHVQLLPACVVKVFNRRVEKPVFVLIFTDRDQQADWQVVDENSREVRAVADMNTTIFLSSQPQHGTVFLDEFAGDVNNFTMKKIVMSPITQDLTISALVSYRDDESVAAMMLVPESNVWVFTKPTMSQKFIESNGSLSPEDDEVRGLTELADVAHEGGHGLDCCLVEPVPIKVRSLTQAPRPCCSVVVPVHKNISFLNIDELISLLGVYINNLKGLESLCKRKAALSKESFECWRNAIFCCSVHAEVLTGQFNCALNVSVKAAQSFSELIMSAQLIAENLRENSSCLCNQTTSLQ